MKACWSALGGKDSLARQTRKDEKRESLGPDAVGIGGESLEEKGETCRSRGGGRSERDEGRDIKMIKKNGVRDRARPCGIRAKGDDE